MQHVNRAVAILLRSGRCLSITDRADSIDVACGGGS